MLLIQFSECNFLRQPVEGHLVDEPFGVRGRVLIAEQGVSESTFGFPRVRSSLQPGGLAKYGPDHGGPVGHRIAVWTIERLLNASLRFGAHLPFSVFETMNGTIMCYPFRLVDRGVDEWSPRRVGAVRVPIMNP